MTTKLLATLMLPMSLVTSSCALGHPADASCTLEAEDLPKLLRSVQPLIEKGYGDAEIQALLRLWESMPVRETRASTFSITYRGEDTALRVEVKKESPKELEIWFITQPELAKEIQKQMKQFLRDVPLPLPPRKQDK